MSYFNILDSMTASGGTALWIRTCFVSSDKFVRVFLSGSIAYGRVYQISGDSIVDLYGSSLFGSIKTGNENVFDICKVRDNVFAICYISGSYSYIATCTCTGSEISVVTTQVSGWSSANHRVPGIARLEDDKIVTSLGSDQAGNVVYFRCMTYNGSTWTLGTEIWPNVGASTYGRMTSVGTNKVLYVHHRMGDNYGQAMVCSISGTTITPGSFVTFDYSRDAYFLSCCNMGTDKAVICCLSPETPATGRAYAVSISGTVPSYGPTFIFNPKNTYPVGCHQLNDTTHFMVVYPENTEGSIGKYQICEVDWSTKRIISLSGEHTFVDTVVGGGWDYGLDIAIDSNNKVVIAYQDDSDNDYAKLIYGECFYRSILPPTAINLSNGAGKNLIEFKPCVPIDYFFNLNNWNVLDGGLGAESTINSSKLRIDIPDGVDTWASVINKGYLPDGDFIVSVSISDYVADAPGTNNGIAPYLRLDSLDNRNRIYLHYKHDDGGHQHWFAYAYDGGSTTYGTNYYLASRATKLRIRRVGTIYYADVYVSGWTNVGQYDFGDYALDIKEINLINGDIGLRGGYVEFDNFYVTPRNYCFRNDTFDNLDNWQQGSSNGSVAINSGRVKLTITDSLDGFACVYNKYPLSMGDWSFDIDLFSYVAYAAGTDDALITYLKIQTPHNDNVLYFTYQHDSVGHRAWLFYIIDGGSGVAKTKQNIGSTPSKMRVVKSGSIFALYVYTGSWVLVDSQDFSGFEDELIMLNILAADSNLRGGYVEYDNLVLNKGINSYNLYYKQHKCPNCYFRTLDDWTITKGIGTETASLYANSLRLYIPSGVASWIKAEYNYPLISGTQEAVVDLKNWVPDNASWGPQVGIMFSSSDGNTWFKLYFDTYSGYTRCYVKYRINGGSVITSTADVLLPTPPKLMVRRGGNYLQGYYYNNGWIQHISQDMDVYAANLTIFELSLGYQTGNYGGYIDLGDLIITPSVVDDYDGVINDIIDLSYVHDSLVGESTYCYELTSDGSESNPSEEIHGTPQLLGVPYNNTTIAELYQNIITFQHGCPNEYFNNLDSWTVTKNTGNETATIVDGKLQIDLPDWEAGDLRAFYDYDLPDCDFEVIINIPTYFTDTVTAAILYWFRLFDNTDYKNHAAIYYSLTSIGEHRMAGRLRVNDVGQDSLTGSLGSRPTKLKIVRSETSFYLYYYISSWNLIDSRDFGSYVSLVKRLQLIGQSHSNRGGYVDFDNLCIIPGDNFFLNDTFDNLDRWVERGGVNYTISLVSGAVRIDGEDSIGAYAQLTNIFSIPQGDFSIEIDLVNYVADDPGTDNALQAMFRVGDMDDNNTVYLTYANKSAGHRAWLTTKINGGSPTIGSEIGLDSQPSKFKIVRSGSIIYVYVYTDSWIVIDQQDFGSYAIALSNVTLEISSSNNRCGYADFDNLIFNYGANSYNIYWKKDKCPNCYFYNLDDWTIIKSLETETSEIINGQFKCTIPNSSGAQIEARYNNTLQDEDFVLTLDILDYSPNNLTYGMYSVLKIRSETDYVDNFYILLYRENISIYLYYTYYINSVRTDAPSPTSIPSHPTKFRFVREGNYLKLYYYITDWVLYTSVDFSSRVSNVKYLDLYTFATSGWGGSAIYDNLIITPSVKDDYDGVINDIIDLSYVHTNLDYNHVYCYEITAAGSESSSSEETYGIPEKISSPEGVDAFAGPGLEQITIEWDEV